MPKTGKSVRQQFRLTTLGGFVLWRRGGDAIESWTPTGLGEKPCALLAYLACQGDAVDRESLTVLLWEGVERGRARNSLRQALFRIRSLLGADAIVDTVGGLRLAHPLDIDLRTLANDPLSRREGRRGFARPTEIRGRAFAAWCEEVRESGRLIRTGNGSAGALHGDGTVRWLEWLWQRACEGNPVSAWIPHALDAASREVLAEVAAGCRNGGGRVARVVSRGPAYQPFALERDLAAVLWEMPGAAGVRPEHRDAMSRVAAGQRAQPLLLRTAIVDLITAVAEDAPILVQIEEPERYATGALRELVGELSTQPACPVMLLLAARDGADPVSEHCLQPPEEFTR